MNGWDKDQVSGLELQVDDYDRLDQVAEDIYFDLTERQDRNGNTFYARSIKELNPMIFNWLDVLDINVVVILALMLSVAGFTMISGLLIIILERTNMIGILKALGQNNNSIRKIFLYVSFFLIWQRNVVGEYHRYLSLFASISFPYYPIRPFYLLFGCRAYRSESIFTVPFEYRDIGRLHVDDAGTFLFDYED